MILEPSEIGIQALMMLACHGQEISTLSLCWNFISHACRMAQALSLHLPNTNSLIGSDAISNRNCLFWSLLIVEKRCHLHLEDHPFYLGICIWMCPHQVPNRWPYSDPRRHLPQQHLYCREEQNLKSLELCIFSRRQRSQYFSLNFKMPCTARAGG